MSQIPSFDLPLPDLGPRPGAARKATPDPDQAEAGHSFRRLLDRHAEAAQAEEGGADEPPRPEAPSEQADEAPDDPSLALAAIPSPAKDASGELPVLPIAAPVSQQMQGAQIKADATAVAILPLGAAAGLPSQQAAVAVALFGGKAPVGVSGASAPSAGDAVNQQPPIPVPAQAPAPALPASAAVLTQDPTVSTAPELTQAASAIVRSKPTVAATPATAAENVASKSPLNLVNQSPITFVAAQAAAPAEAGDNETGVAQPAKPVLPQVPQLKKETDAAATLADSDGITPQSGTPATPSFDSFAAAGPLTDSPRAVANHYNRVGDAAHRALSDGTMAPADQVSLRLIHGLSEGKRAIQVQLHPAELGSIDVKMHWQGDRLTAQFVVDRPETLDLLQRDARALERALGGAGIDLSDSGLSFSLRDQGGWQQDGRVPSAMTTEASSLGEIQETTTDEPLGQIVRDGIISIRV